MHANRADRLDRLVEPGKDHVLGPVEADITLVEYGSYLCPYCHAHEVVRRLRDQFGDRLRYVYRHLPLTDRTDATRAAELAEYVAETAGEFWEVHDTLMRRAVSGPGELDNIASRFGVAQRAKWDPAVAQAVAARVRADARSGIDSGARVTPTFSSTGGAMHCEVAHVQAHSHSHRRIGDRAQSRQSRYPLCRGDRRAGDRFPCHRRLATGLQQRLCG
jgi:NhaA family Na+:H+ antiporter